MVEPIRRMTVAQFVEILGVVQLSRRIDAVHLHHTWRPRRVDFRGLATIEAMRRYHMEVNHWSDIAQHLTIDPAGGLWSGRNWNQPPASSAGANGNREQGPFMIEMVGDFDRGQDPFDGAQREAAVTVVAALLARFALKKEAVRFHRQLGSPKTCPGTGIDHAGFLADIAPARGSRSAKRAVYPAAAQLGGSALARDVGVTEDPASAEVTENEGAAVRIDRMAADLLATRQRARRGEPAQPPATPIDARGGDSWNDIALHVINTSRGELSQGGEFDSTPDDLDAIVESIRAYATSTAHGHLVLHAHGGLVGETKALEYARAMRPWWERHSVYPLFFVWETQLAEIFQQLLTGPRAATDVSDFALEVALKIPATTAWSAMKESARRASSPDASDGNPGGAWLFAQRLAAMLGAPGAPKLSIHAVGHSAGSIFHAHLLPLLIDLGLQVDTLSLLAPACRTSLFRKKLAEPVGKKKIRKLSLFTMEEDAELQDTVIKVYRKSLLYFVSRACEGPLRVSILGLHTALQKNDDMQLLFGIPPASTGIAELQLSIAPGEDPNVLTRALHHGDFDNDPATMGSVLRRILGVPDDPPLGAEGFPFQLDQDRVFRAVAAPAAVQPSPPSTAVAPSRPGRAADSGDRAVRRQALCIGIDTYKERPLSGCVNDAKSWGRVLEGLGFEVKYRFDEAATLRAILDDLEGLVSASKAGDVLVFQYSGHGTQLPDLNGDESDRFDEAFVPHDYTTGAFLIDDDIASVLAGLPKGVAMTLFMDCCHSGTNSRFMPPIRPRGRTADKVRFLPVTPELIEAHRGFRAGLPRPAVIATEASLPGVIHFAACRDDEFAWESGGQGDFTAAGTSLLAGAVSRGDNNETFLQAIHSAVVVKQRQHPLMMQPASGMEGLVLLKALAKGSEPTRTDRDGELLGHVAAMDRILRERAMG